MKKILFVMPKFGAGGAEKSLLMLLYLLSSIDDIEVDVMFFKLEGIFLTKIPQNINLIDTEKSLKAAFSGFKFIKIFGFRELVLSILRPIVTVVSSLFAKSYNHRNQIRWCWFFRHLIQNNEKEYDYACGYLDGESIYYIVDKVNAKVKYGWNQNDYTNIGAQASIDNKYYEKLDKIITLSDECNSILRGVFPQHEKRIEQIPPIVSAEYIQKCAEEFYPQEFISVPKLYKIVSVGRLVEQKGFDIAIDSASILKERGVTFRWYIIGNGEQAEILALQVKRLGLSDHICFLGEKSNPYPYILHADVFVQSSRFEGKSVILNEAKMLAKPIIVTKYPTVYDQVVDGKSGIMTEINPTDLADKIEELLNNDKKKNTLVRNLKNSIFQDNWVSKAYLDLFSVL